jgi:hypothetical protein
LLVALAALFLFPYLFLGRCLLPLDLIPIFQPWAQHTRELWSHVPPVHNPLLDALQQYYPRRVYMTGALHGGWLPLWNPYVYGGSPFLATQQAAVLYPPAWALTLFAPERQFGVSAFLHLSLAAVGGYLFFRQLALRPAAAMAGAVAFAFNGFMIVWLAYLNVTQWTLCWLPLALALWEKGRERDSLAWIALSGGALALCILGGHGQSSSYVLLAWGAWALFRTLASERPRANLPRWVALPALLALGLSLGHLLPSLDYLPRTDRGAHLSWPKVVQAGMPPAQLWTFVLPRLFGDGTEQFAQQFWLPQGGRARMEYPERSFYPGVTVLVLAAGAWALFRRDRGAAPQEREHRRLALFSLLLTIGAVLLAMVTPLYRPLWALAPGFGQFTAPARILCLAAWGLACLAALGTQALTDPEAGVREKAFRAMALTSGLLALLVLIGHFIYGGAAPPGVNELLARQGLPPVDALATRDLVLALLWLVSPVVLAGLARPLSSSREILKPTLAGGLAVVVVAADLFAFGVPFNPATDGALLKAETPELATLRGRAEPCRFLSPGPPGAETDFRQRMPSNLPATYGLADLSGSDSFVSLRYREWERATAKAASSASPFSRLGAPNLRAAGVRFYLTNGRLRPPGLSAVAGAALLEDPRALPYARLHTNAQSLGTRDELLADLSLSNRVPMVALTSGPDAPTYNGLPRVVPFRTQRVNGNRLALEGDAPQAGLLVVAEQFDPGWRARVDGAPAEIVPADHLLIGIPLKAGRRRVELAYAPETFRVGTFGSLAALACLCGLLAAGWKRR